VAFRPVPVFEFHAVLQFYPCIKEQLCTLVLNGALNGRQATHE
jgi:hypothetical protein